MAETHNSDKEHQRRQMSRLASGWYKLNKITLEEYAKTVKGTRSNLFSQIAKPDTGQRMSVEMLFFALTTAGVRVDADGVWSIFDNRAQTWHWESIDDAAKASIVKFVEVLHEECAPAKPFTIRKAPVPPNSIYRMQREHALISIFDRSGNEMSATLVADSEEKLQEGIDTFLSTGFFEELPPQQISPEYALQVINGAAPKPREQPDFTTYDWPAWMTIISVLQSRGVTPQDIARAHQIELPIPKLAPQVPQLPQQPYKVDPDAKPESWKF